MDKIHKILIITTLLFSIPVGVYLATHFTYFFGKAEGVPANLIIDFNSLSNSNFAYKNLAQGGEEPNQMLSSVVGKVRTLSPSYIRIDHLYDFYHVISKTNGSLSFKWTELDKTLADIKATGAKPYLSLSYDYSNYSEWQEVVQRTIEHISGTLATSDVYYEIWNEPDYFGNYKTYGDKNYFDLYSYAIDGANNAKNTLPFKIGGPATTNAYKNWAVDFAKFVIKNNLRLDFYSWHEYSLDINKVEKDVQDIKTWLTESGLPENEELIISEFGPDSNNNEIYDNSFGAIHTLAGAASLEDKVNKVFTFEIKDGPGDKKLWGRWGLLTNDKFGTPEPKPRFTAFSFLNDFTGRSVSVIGEGSWVKAFAKTNGKNIKVLLVNYDPQGNHTEAVPVIFNNLPSTNFKYTRTDWNGTQVKDIKVATDSASWSVTELMNPNSASILEVTP